MINQLNANPIKVEIMKYAILITSPFPLNPPTSPNIAPTRPYEITNVAIFTKISASGDIPNSVILIVNNHTKNVMIWVKIENNIPNKPDAARKITMIATKGLSFL
jgi:hypothetical protein